MSSENFICRKNETAVLSPKIPSRDRHLRSSAYPNPFSIIGDSKFNDANTSLSNFLKTLSKSGQIAPTMHKQPLTKEVVAKLYEEGELSLPEIWVKMAAARAHSGHNDCEIV